MTRQAAWVGVLALCGVSVVGQTQTPQRPPAFRGGTNFVVVDVYPTQNGRIVEGLKAADFQVLENGKPQSVEQFEFIRVEPTPEAERRDPSSIAESLEQAADPHNRLFVIYLDHYHTNVSGSHNARRPLVDLLQRMLAPNDLFGVTTPHTRPRDITFARKTDSLERQLSDQWFWGMRQRLEREPDEAALEECFRQTASGKPRVAQDGVATRSLGDVLIARRREDKVLTSLDDLLDYLGRIREARKSILIFTNGWLLYEPDPATMNTVLGAGDMRIPTVGLGGGKMMVGDPQGGGTTASCNQELQRLFMLDNKQHFRDLVSRATRQNVTFYPINPSGIEVFEDTLAQQPANLGSNPDLAREYMLQNMDRVTFRTDSMRTLADNTGGLTIITNDLTGGLMRVSNDLSAYYLLGYYSTDKRFDGGYRRIEVKIAKPDVRVNARRGYYAPVEAAIAAASAPATAAPAIPPTFTEALDVLGKLRPDTELFAYATLEGSEVSVALELGSSEIGKPQWAKGAVVQVNIVGPDGDVAATATAQIEAAQRGALVRIPLATPPAAGAWRATAKIAVTPVVEATTPIRMATSGILGRPLVFRATPSGTSPLKPVAEPLFRRTERVHLEWPLRGPVERREARLLGRTGQPLAVPVTVTERAADGRTVLAADLVLTPLAEGDYVIEIMAGSAAVTERQHVAIRIVR